jgi:integrase/recombinase XerD
LAYLSASEYSLNEEVGKSPINWRIEVDRLVGAYAESTLRGYRSDFTLFEKWCNSELLDPLPASPITVAAFISHDAQRCSPSTLRRRMSAIRKIHRLLRLANPVEDEEVTIAMRRVFRSKGRRQRQAKGLTGALRDKLTDAAPRTLASLRDKALLHVGYDTLCRRSELVGLCVEDISQGGHGVATILVRRAKNHFSSCPREFGLPNIAASLFRKPNSEVHVRRRRP